MLLSYCFVCTQVVASAEGDDCRDSTLCFAVGDDTLGQQIVAMAAVLHVYCSSLQSVLAETTVWRHPP